MALTAGVLFQAVAVMQVMNPDQVGFDVLQTSEYETLSAVHAEIAQTVSNGTPISLSDRIALANLEATFLPNTLALQNTRITFQAFRLGVILAAFSLAVALTALLMSAFGPARRATPRRSARQKSSPAP